MAEEDNEISCDTHGKRPRAFVCSHLFSGQQQGFHCAQTGENLLSPDAWCNACQRRFAQTGDWTEEAMAQADIRLVCDRCYEMLRERNWLEEPGELERLLERAIPYLKEKQERVQRDYRIGQHERWDWDQESAQLTFSHGGKPRVIADVVFVGSVATRPGTWLWSWANSSVLEGAKARMTEVRRYGQENGVLKLAAARWTAEEVDGHEMTAIAAYLLEAQGFYRAPAGYGFTFLLMKQLRWAQ